MYLKPNKALKHDGLAAGQPRLSLSVRGIRLKKHKDINKKQASSTINITGGSITGCGTAIHIEDPERTTLTTNELKIDKCLKGIVTGHKKENKQLAHPQTTQPTTSDKNKIVNWFSNLSVTIIGGIIASILTIIIVYFYIQPWLQTTQSQDQQHIQKTLKPK